MRIFGVEISRPVAAAEAQPVRSFEIGDSGTHILNGLISEEYNQQLIGIKAFQKYEEMRKSDATARAADRLATPSRWAGIRRRKRKD